MSKKQILVILCLIGLFLIGVNSKEGIAKEYPSYTLKKGKKVAIQSIVKDNPLTKSEEKKYKSLQWKSTNEKVVSILKNKYVKGLKKGSVYIRGYEKNKKVLAIKIIVGTPVSQIKLANVGNSFLVGDTVKLAPRIFPSNASNKNVFYYSQNENVATVSKNGKITTTGSGSTKIQIISKDGRAKKYYQITVQSELNRVTTKGEVQGLEDVEKKSLIWYGIPYGATTEGKNRWRAPQPVEAWQGIMNATVPRTCAAQYGDGTTYTGTEDCLFVNIYRPNNGKKNLPVMVYLHGGGNATGESTVDFSDFAVATNAIVVTVEYRLGAFGYLSHPALQDGTEEENSGNFTLLDIKAALTWVRDEIGVFGGNSSNVTLAGFSAGARNVLLCTISPIMNGLYQKVISLSGGCNVCEPEMGEKSVNEKLAAILVERGKYEKKGKALEYIEQASKEEIRELFDSLSTTEVANMYKSPALKLGAFPQGFNDGVVIPKDGFEVIKVGSYNRVPMILGSDVSEFSGYAWNGSLTSQVAELSAIGSSNQMMNLIENGVKYGSMLQSGHYIEKTAELIQQDAGHLDVYAYRFKWGTDASVTDGFYSRFVGAFHGVSRDFLRGVYRNSYKSYSPKAISSANKKGRVALTNKMRAYIKNFLYNSTPNSGELAEWKTWNSNVGEAKIMIFNANATQDISAMSDEYYKENDTFAQMRQSLSRSEYNILTNSLFSGRFFMPESVPAYE